MIQTRDRLGKREPDRFYQLMSAIKGDKSLNELIMQRAKIYETALPTIIYRPGEPLEYVYPKEVDSAIEQINSLIESRINWLKSKYFK